MFKIESMPAKICLGFTSVMFFLYGLSFMFFGDCYVIGGNGCFSLLNNGVPVGDVAYGHGGPETAFNGALFFGIFMSTMLILNEGARGKWVIMLPVIIGSTIMSICLWVYWNAESAAGDLPKYVSIIVTLAYTGAYVLLREEGVNEGLSDFKPSLKINDKIAMVSLILLVFSGLFYSLRMIFTPDTVIAEGFPTDYTGSLDLDNGLGEPFPTTVSVSGALILIYTLFSALVLLDGASGKWTILHPSAFAFITVTISIFIGLIAGNARNASDQNQLDAMTGALVMLLVLISYFRLKSEGIEDDMTFRGELQEDNGKFANILLLFALTMGALFSFNEILLPML
ncbi:MAG: hypothetical protein CMB64_01095 [Euryarchaeota archaeon]|nr:hypothetical protein [Euryarchaeota archaeon]|tara:strand:- start:574 stop:1596 length:1023 start_codon:yes stop_codon:yes gene_type:complete